MAVTGKRYIHQQINNDPTTAGSNASVAMLADGGWIVSWAHLTETRSDIYQQRYGKDGAEVGGEIRVNSSVLDDQANAKVAALSDGGWIVTWQSHDQNGSDTAIYQQRYDRFGNPLSAESRINASVNGAQREQSITGLSDGGWVVTWTSIDPISRQGNVYQQRYNSAGDAVGAETSVSSNTTGGKDHSFVTALANGGWVTTWLSIGLSGPSEIYQQRYNSEGIPQGNESLVQYNGTAPTITALAGGGWLVTWAGSGLGSVGSDIYQQRYDSSGAPQGSAVIVNATKVGHQFSPSIAAMPGGGWIVAWADYSRQGMYVQRYDATGGKQGEEERVGSIDIYDQRTSITALPNGGWIAAFRDGQIYQYAETSLTDPRLTVHTERLTGDSASDVFDVDLGGLSDGDVIDGGEGKDEILMTSAGTMDLTRPATLNSIEAVTGTSESDTIIANVERFSGVLTLEGAGGQDTLLLRNGSYDLRPKTIQSIEQIRLDEGGSIALSSKNLALSIHGKTGQSTQVWLDGDIFGDAEKSQLFRQGLTTIRDDSGTYTNAAPELLVLSNLSIGENAATGMQVGFFTAEDPNTKDALTYALIDDAGGRFAIDGNKLVVANGLLLDYEQGASHIIRVRVSDDQGLSLEKTFTIEVGDANPENILGTSANDELVGGVGSDTLNGAGGADRMEGRGGDDTFYVDHVGDRVVELSSNGANDRVYTSISYVLPDHVEHLRAIGSGAFGLTGNAAANAITGADDRDRIDSGPGDDTLDGGYGNDVLQGGTGKDVFVFAGKLGTYKTDRKVNFDTISDFKLREDKIHLENAIFSKLKKTGKLNKAFFTIGNKANDKNDFIVYDKAKGLLSYDVDGSGGKKAVEFAKVKAKLNPTASDFLVI